MKKFFVWVGEELCVSMGTLTFYVIYVISVYTSQVMNSLTQNWHGNRF